MIQGTPKLKLTPEIILSKITEYDVFRYYMPHQSWEVNKLTISPFMRGGGYEKDPSFMISNRHGVLTFIDFGDTKHRGNCFTFVQQMFGLEYNEALLKVDFDFGLGIISKDQTGNYKKIVSEYKQPEDIGKRYSFIQVTTRKFTDVELGYWKQFGITIEELRENKVYAIKEVFLNRQRFLPVGVNEMTFGYYYDGSWKIYRPLADKQHKWLPNNVPIIATDGFENIKNCKIAFITKSKKDYMVVRKVYPNVCAVQNEGIACFSVENVDYIKSNSERQILSFDCDDPGIENAKTVVDVCGFESMTVPRHYLFEGIKDWADLARVHGLGAVEKCFKEKGLL